MIEKEHNLFWRFSKMKHLVFYGIEVEDTYMFIMDCCESLLKVWVVEQSRVEFVNFQLHGNVKL